MNPDWADKPEDVPYAKMDDPQSLNLYGYVCNNPLSRVDADGHFPILGIEIGEDLAKLVNEGTATGAMMIAALGRGSAARVGAAGGISLSAITIGAAIPFAIANHLAPTVGQSDADEIAQRDANLGGTQEHHEATPEPQTSTSGAGARQGGGRSGQKSNTDRTDSAKDKLADAQSALAAARASKPSKGRSDTIKKAEAQVKHWQSKAAEKSENHPQKPKVQQQ